MLLWEHHLKDANPTKDESIEKAWVELENKIARIPLDKDGTTVRCEDDPYMAETLLKTEGPEFDYELWRYMDRDEIPRWTQRHRWRENWEVSNSLQALFSHWYEHAIGRGLTFCYSELPRMFRFALKRPLMPEDELRNVLMDLDLDPTYSMAHDLHDKRVRRARQIMMGIDPELHKSSHGDENDRDIMPEGISKCQNVQKLPTRGKSLGEPKPRSNQSEQAEDDTNAIEVREACSVWGLFRAGEIDFSSALNRFRAILGDPRISDYDLAWRLETFDLPLASLLGPDDILHQPSIREMNEDARDIIEELKHHVESCRLGVLTLDEALTFICDSLAHLDVDREVFTSLIYDQELTPYEAALQIWEWASMESDLSPTEAEGDLDDLHVGRTPIEILATDFLKRYRSAILDGLGPGLALTEYREEIGVDDFSSAQVSYMLRRVLEETDISETDCSVEHGKSINTAMAPPKQPIVRKTRHYSEIQRRRTDVSRGRSSDPTSRKNQKAVPKGKNSACWRRGFSGTVGNPDDLDYEDLSSSPEEGVSDSLFGLTLPTKEARRIGERIGLPSDFVQSRIRSLTPRRASVRKRRKLSMSIASPKKRRKVSSAQRKVQQDRSEGKEKQEGVLAEAGQDQEGSILDPSPEGSVLSKADGKSSTERGSGTKGSGRAGSPCHTSSELEPSADSVMQSLEQTESEKKQSCDTADFDRKPPMTPDSGGGDVWQSHADRTSKEGFNSETIVGLLRTRLLYHNVLQVGLVQHREAISSAASDLLDDLNGCVHIGAVKQPSGSKDREIISLLTRVAMNPTAFNVFALVTSVSGDEIQATTVSLDVDTLQVGSPAYRLMAYFTKPSPDLASHAISRSPSPEPEFTGRGTGSTTSLTTCQPSPRLDPKRCRSDLTDLSLLPKRSQDPSNHSEFSPSAMKTSQNSLGTERDLDTSTSHQGPFECAYEPQTHDSDHATEALTQSHSAEGTTQVPLDEGINGDRGEILEDKTKSKNLQPGADVALGHQRNPGLGRSRKASRTPKGFHYSSAEDIVDWAVRERKSIFVLSEKLRRKRRKANKQVDYSSYFQNSSSNTGSSCSTSALNKLFDKYRGMP